MPQCAYGKYIESAVVASRDVRNIAAMALLGLVALSGAAGAQALGSVAADRARIDSLSNVLHAASAAPRGYSWQIVKPDVRLVWNSDIPYSLNDGPMWAGRGLNASVTAGVAGRFEGDAWSVAVVAAPTFASSANEPFDIVVGREPGRSTYSSPWHIGNASADLPLRFGDRPIHTIGLGESSVTLRFRNVAFGASNAAEWWGPTIRNALVLSDNAGGIPRIFVGTAHPAHTRFGDFTAELLAGTLTESLFFDTLSTNDFRSIGGFTVSFRPAVDSGLTFGISRMVYAPASGAAPSLRSAIDVLRWSPRASAGDSASADQIASVFVNWRFPESGLEVYGELARMELPRSLGEFLRTPRSTGGYTLGSQWAMKRTAESTLRLQGEVTFLDQELYYPDRPPLDFYTGHTAPQGYTQRGQVLGAAIGPGGSSQWLALDYLVPRWQAGFFVGRVRWENDAMYRQQFATFFSHDATILSGIRGAIRLPMFDVSSELTVGRRLGYLFQSGFGNPNNAGRVDVQNITLAARISPR